MWTEKSFGDRLWFANGLSYGTYMKIPLYQDVDALESMEWGIGDCVVGVFKVLFLCIICMTEYE